ncbi:MAG: 2-oxoacid:acceptor oxidoreductase subunit alpha [Anaerolineae bacterium]|nr:2-oxoacid:acceptor oxidoreductase subunit alpha [Anaerolineae bacterium]
MQRMDNDLVIRIGGESGEGIVTTGEVFARIAAFAGLEVYTVRTIPAEIKGGHVMFQVRASQNSVFSQGDELDMLLAFNQEAYENHAHLLKPGGILVFNSDELTPPTPQNGTAQYGLPLNELAKSISFVRGKNIVAIGALVKLFDLPYERAQKVVERQLGRKGGELLRQNLQALETGYKYVEEHISRESPFHLKGREATEGDRLVISGNQALSLGVITAGCKFYAGYPITPASDIMEFLAAQFPKLGGTMIQAEDEMAALAMAIGASFTGEQAMTATSGPGLALMVELLGHASMTETPVVIVDVQRAGPSTGMPTKVAQGDLRLAVYGGNDEAPRIVVAPISVEDCFYQTINAFNLAEKYQVPVILLSDQDMSVRVETIPPLRLKDVHLEPRLLAQPTEGNGADEPSLHGYERYVDTPSGISPMSLPGTPGGQYTAEGLEHDATGAPNYTPEMHATNTEKRFRKIQGALEDARRWNMFERLGSADPVVGIIGWGSTSGPVREAVQQAQENGMRVAALYPKLLCPLPEEDIRRFSASLKAVIVPEMNYLGQFAEMLEPRLDVPVIHLNKYSGVPFNANEIYKRIRETYEWATEVGKEAERMSAAVALR